MFVQILIDILLPHTQEQFGEARFLKDDSDDFDNSFQVKRLGKLFDEWIEMTKQDVDEVSWKQRKNMEHIMDL